MISPVSNASQPQSVDQTNGASPKKPKPNTPQSNPDSVQLSSAALSALKKSPDAESQSSNDSGNGEH
jgi:hypothetical protein